MDRRHFRATQILRRKHPLHDKEIRGPVTEGNHKPKAQHDSGPVNTHRVIGKRHPVHPQVLRSRAFSIARVDFSPARASLNLANPDGVISPRVFWPASGQTTVQQWDSKQPV